MDRLHRRRDSSLQWFTGKALSCWKEVGEQRTGFHSRRGKRANLQTAAQNVRIAGGSTRANLNRLYFRKECRQLSFVRDYTSNSYTFVSHIWSVCTRQLHVRFAEGKERPRHGKVLCGFTVRTRIWSGTPVARRAHITPRNTCSVSNPITHSAPYPQCTENHQPVAWNPHQPPQPVGRASPRSAVMERSAVNVCAGVWAQRHGHSRAKAHAAAAPLHTPTGGKTRP